MRPNTAPHSSSPKPFPPPAKNLLTDEVLAKDFWSSLPASHWRQAGSDLRYIRGPIETFVRGCFKIPFEVKTPQGVRNTVRRVDRLVRKNWTEKAIKTRRKSTLKKKQDELFQGAG